MKRAVRCKISFYWFNEVRRTQSLVSGVLRCRRVNDEEICVMECKRDPGLLR